MRPETEEIAEEDLVILAFITTVLSDSNEGIEIHGIVS